MISYGTTLDCSYQPRGALCRHGTPHRTPPGRHHRRAGAGRNRFTRRRHPDRAALLVNGPPSRPTPLVPTGGVLLRRVTSTNVHAGRRPPSVEPGLRRRQGTAMELLLVLTLIVVIGLFAQAVGTDSRDIG